MGEIVPQMIRFGSGITDEMQKVICNEFGEIWLFLEGLKGRKEALRGGEGNQGPVLPNRDRRKKLRREGKKRGKGVAHSIDGQVDWIKNKKGQDTGGGFSQSWISVMGNQEEEVMGGTEEGMKNGVSRSIFLS